MRLVFLALTASIGLTACAPTIPRETSYLSEERQLADECRARGGILAPTGGPTGQPRRDNVCKITGGASRLTSQDRS